MTMIAEVDHKSTFNRLNRDPSLAVIPSSMEATNLILERESDGTPIYVVFESESEVGLWAFWVVTYNNLLVHVHTCLTKSFFLSFSNPIASDRTSRSLHAVPINLSLYSFVTSIQPSGFSGQQE